MFRSNRSTSDKYDKAASLTHHFKFVVCYSVFQSGNFPLLGGLGSICLTPCQKWLINSPQMGAKIGIGIGIGNGVSVSVVSGGLLITHVKFFSFFLFSLIASQANWFVQLGIVRFSPCLQVIVSSFALFAECAICKHSYIYYANIYVYVYIQIYIFICIYSERWAFLQTCIYAFVYLLYVSIYYSIVLKLISFYLVIFLATLFVLCLLTELRTY